MSEPRKSLILNIQIPYCIQPLSYIRGYHAVGSNMEKNAYMAALKKELLTYEGELEEYEIHAVRLSGGSVTVMSPDLLGDLLSTVRKTLPLVRGAEISFDALPNTIGTPSLTGIGAGRPNRAELMIRSESDEELKTLNCPFRTVHTRNAMLFFHRFHLNNVSMTIHYGIPGQTEHSWENTLHACVIMNPAHITIQGVIPGTAGQPPVLSDKDQFSLYCQACSYLEENGYRQYGAGHFAKQHCESRFHALSMDGCEVLGIGAGARTVMDGYYTRNNNNRFLYIRNAGDFEKMTAQVGMAEEHFMMERYIQGRLRTVWGLDEDRFHEQFGQPLPENLRAQLEAFVSEKKLTCNENRFIPTKKGLFEANRV